ncbi:MAG: hypothetical protein LBO72_06430 [Helicobacteraceae bacterium]|jgi:hypothetical protein|nr:hypothetical protein [Helicobacteraceae bacterium]
MSKFFAVLLACFLLTGCGGGGGGGGSDNGGDKQCVGSDCGSDNGDNSDDNNDGNDGDDENDDQGGDDEGNDDENDDQQCVGNDCAYIAFYDDRLELLGGVKIAIGATLDLDAYKTKYNVSAWYLTEDIYETPSPYTVSENINFYAGKNVVEIRTQKELSEEKLSRLYMLMNDIALAVDSDAGFDSIKGWKPVDIKGADSIFNGNGHKISGLWINRPDETSIGLFGQVHHNVKIKNLGVEIASGKEVKGKENVGAIAGHVLDSSITNVYVKGNVSAVGEESYVGGIVGNNRFDSSITDGNFTGAVNGAGNKTGGIAGENYAGVITNCRSAGSVSGRSRVGGIVGNNENYENDVGSITNSRSTAEINGAATQVGGIAGSNSGYIANSRFTGRVSATGYAGGIVGKNAGSIKNCGFEGEVNGNDIYGAIGGIAGSASGTITNCRSFGNVTNQAWWSGGIVGYVSGSATIINNYSAGSVSGDEQIGGIVGGINGGYQHIIDITNNYSTANVSGNRYVGGIVGREAADHKTISNNSAINGELTSVNGDVNRVIGYYSGGDGISNNFALSNMIGALSSDNAHAGISKTKEQFQTQSTYENGLGWSFGNDDDHPWKIKSGKNDGLPYLYWEDQ